MSRTFEPLIALLSGVALLMLGHGLLGTVLAVRGGLEGFGSQTLGAIGAMYFVGFLVGTYLAPRMIQRVGHVRAFAFFTALVACSALLHELVPTAVMWLVLRLLTGMSMVGFYTIVESCRRQGIDPLAVDQHVQTHQVGGLEALFGISVRELPSTWGGHGFPSTRRNTSKLCQKSD